MRCLFLVDQLVSARDFILSVLLVNDERFGSLCKRLLQLLQRIFRFGGLAGFNEVRQAACQMLDVSLHTKILGRALVVLAEIFDGSLLDRHKMSRRITESIQSVNLWYTLTAHL